MYHSIVFITGEAETQGMHLNHKYSSSIENCDSPDLRALKIEAQDENLSVVHTGMLIRYISLSI